MSGFHSKNSLLGLLGFVIFLLLAFPWSVRAGHTQPQFDLEDLSTRTAVEHIRLEDPHLAEVYQAYLAAETDAQRLEFFRGIYRDFATVPGIEFDLSDLNEEKVRRWGWEAFGQYLFLKVAVQEILAESPDFFQSRPLVIKPYTKCTQWTRGNLAHVRAAEADLLCIDNFGYKYMPLFRAADQEFNNAILTIIGGIGDIAAIFIFTGEDMFFTDTPTWDPDTHGHLEIVRASEIKAVLLADQPIMQWNPEH